MVDLATNSPRILALWSAPRSRSTAFYRMMTERGDFASIHEPFSYLADFGETTINNEPIRTESNLLSAIRRLSASTPVFFKDTTDERYSGLLEDKLFLSEDATHTFIIRNPKYTIPSYYALNPNVRLHQIGMESLWEIYAEVERLTGNQPVVFDGDELVRDPASLVSAYCERVSIPYVPEALRWRPGDRVEWRPTARWHEAASASGGFHTNSRQSSTEPIDIESHPVLSGYLKHHLAFYELLWEHRIRPPVTTEPHSTPDQ